MVNKKIVFRDWTFLRFNLYFSSCYLALWDDSNGIYDLWYRQTFSRFFWIFMSKVQYHKVVRLSTWVVESNSSFDKMKVWLNRSGRMKFQNNPKTGWVETVWFEIRVQQVYRSCQRWLISTSWGESSSKKNPFGYSGSFRFFYRREKKVFKNLKFRKMIKKWI